MDGVDWKCGIKEQKREAWNTENETLKMKNQIMQVKGKVKGRATCYSAAYMSQTRDQKRFTILEAAVDAD